MSKAVGTKIGNSLGQLLDVDVAGDGLVGDFVCDLRLFWISCNLLIGGGL